jgi:hypothetical protein
MSDLARNSQDLSWPLWPVVPIYPYGQRKTLRVEVVKDKIWTLEQVQGILYVIVPIRMTVIKLLAGGLLLYGAIAPTQECLKLIDELVQVHGAVKYLIHPTVSGLEHKVFVGPLARAFPQAQVFVAPEQWSFPVNLPLTWLGFPPQRTHILPPQAQDTPLSEEFDYHILGPVSIGWGLFGEVALFHKPSRTLLVTDTLLALSEDAPPLLQDNPHSLLFHARNYAAETLEDTLFNRRQGWQRTVLLALYFQPQVLKILGLTKTLKYAAQASERSAQTYWGLYPFDWQGDWSQSFQALRGNGGVLVAPILQTLILNRLPQITLDWVEKVCHWDFVRVIPAHFQAPVAANPAQVHHAFAFLRKGATTSISQDFQALLTLEKVLMRAKVLIPRQI